MKKDIVIRLRKEISKRERPYPVELLPELNEAADEIEDLRFQLEGTQGELENALSRERTLLKEQEDCRIGADNLHAEIERLQNERDEARRIYCELFAFMMGREIEDVASSLTWNYYKDSK